MINNIYLDNIQINNTNAICTSVSNPFPIINYSTGNRGGGYGSKITLANPRGFKIATEWIVVGSDFSNLILNKQTFLKVVGDLIINQGATLKVDLANGKSLIVSVKAAVVTGDITASDGTSCKLLVEFATEYPFFQDATLQTQTIGIFGGGGMAVPMGVPMNMSAGAGGSQLVITMGGTFKAFPILRFIGPITNPTFYNQTTDEQLSITTTLSDNTHWIEVDTYLKTAITEAGANVLANVSGDFPNFLVGNNTLVLSASVYNANGKCNIYYRDTYFGL